MDAMSDLSALNLEAGSLVGGYTLISRLGSGAMGSVWRVRDDGGHQYAMKILRDSLAEEDASGERSRDQLTARERLRREAMALQKVRHPGVCGIVDMELDDALAFIVTELIDGKNLREDVRANGRYVGDDLERLGRKLIEAVKAVHAAGIVHRDIKPTNVMVSNTGPVLVDFGIAMGEGESHVTRTGLVMGTPGFIAPEIIDGAESDEMSDWWSVASVLAFAATGEPGFGTKPMMGGSAWGGGCAFPPPGGAGVRHETDDGGIGACCRGKREFGGIAGWDHGRVPFGVGSGSYETLHSRRVVAGDCVGCVESASLDFGEYFGCRR